jgi:hypothetical protein
MEEFYVMKKLLLDGVEFQYGKLTLCDLTKYSSFRGTRRFQVHCEDQRITEVDQKTGKTRQGFYYVYQVAELDKAVSKFLELKNRIDSRIRFVDKRNKMEIY